MMRYLMVFVCGALVLAGCQAAGRGTKEYISTTEASATIAVTADSTVSDQTVADSSAAGEVLGEQRLAKDVIGSIGWDRENVYLPQIQQLLDENHITYVIKRNISGERLDLVCDDGTELMFLEAGDDEGHSFGYEVIMYDGKFNDDGFQEDYLNQYDVTIDEYYYPDLDKKMMDLPVFAEMNQTDLSIARNEIYARHGRMFQDAFLTAVFQRKSWYRPSYSGDEFAKQQDTLLNKTEQANLKAITEYEMVRGFRQSGDHVRLDAVMPGSWLGLRGDGKLVQVTYDLKGGLIWSASPLTLTTMGVYVDSVIYTGNPDGKRLLMFVPQFEDGSIPWMDVYCMSGGALVNMGSVNGAYTDVYLKDGRIYGLGDYFHMQSFYNDIEYEIDGNSVKEIEKNFYEHGNDVTALRDIQIYRDKDQKSATFGVSRGDTVTILGSDREAWVELQDKRTGEKGWMNVIGYECHLPDGSVEVSNDLFEGLNFWG